MKRLAVPALLGLAFIVLGVPIRYAERKPGSSGSPISDVLIFSGAGLVALAAILALIYGLVRFIIWSANAGREHT